MDLLSNNSFTGDSAVTIVTYTKYHYTNLIITLILHLSVCDVSDASESGRSWEAIRQELKTFLVYIINAFLPLAHTCILYGQDFFTGCISFTNRAIIIFV